MSNVCYLRNIKTTKKLLKYALEIIYKKRKITSAFGIVSPRNLNPLTA